jgi:hypothetical protein
MNILCVIFSIISLFQGESHDEAPEASEVKFKIKDEHDMLIGAGKLSSKSPTIYLPVDVHKVSGPCRFLCFSSSNEQIWESNLHQFASTIISIKLSPEYSMLINVQPINKENHYPAMVHDVNLETSDSTSEISKTSTTYCDKTRYLMYLQEPGLPNIPNDVIIESVWTDPDFGGDPVMRWKTKSKRARARDPYQLARVVLHLSPHPRALTPAPSTL